MSKDGPEGPFWSALASFATRTCYANTACDHLVGWANASLRQAPDSRRSSPPAMYTGPGLYVLMVVLPLQAPVRIASH